MILKHSLKNRDNNLWQNETDVWPPKLYFTILNFISSSHRSSHTVIVDTPEEFYVFGPRIDVSGTKPLKGPPDLGHRVPGVRFSGQVGGVRKMATSLTSRVLVSLNTSEGVRFLHQSCSCRVVWDWGFGPISKDPLLQILSCATNSTETLRRSLLLLL